MAITFSSGSQEYCSVHKNAYFSSFSHFGFILDFYKICTIILCLIRFKGLTTYIKSDVMIDFSKLICKLP